MCSNSKRPSPPWRLTPPRPLAASARGPPSREHSSYLNSAFRTVEVNVSTSDSYELIQSDKSLCASPHSTLRSRRRAPQCL